MSSHFLTFFGKIRKSNQRTNFHLLITACYSRKHDSKDSNSSFKVVKSSRNLNDQQDVYDDGTTNWELLAPKGYRYILPGSTGLALQQPIPLPYSYKYSKDFAFEVRDCPMVLKNALAELFQGQINNFSQNLTVITLRQRGKPLFDHESIAMKFLHDSQSICTRLMIAGYWADFINPFSGRPHLSPVIGHSLYISDFRFRCLGFEMKDVKHCTVVKNNQSVHVGNVLKTEDKGDEEKHTLLETNSGKSQLNDLIIADSAKPARFIGNLFTNAPRNLNYFMNLSKKKPLPSN